MEIILDVDIIIRGEKGVFHLEGWLDSRVDDQFAVAAVSSIVRRPMDQNRMLSESVQLAAVEPIWQRQKTQVTEWRSRVQKVR